MFGDFLREGKLWNSIEQITEKFLLLVKENEDSGYEVVIKSPHMRRRVWQALWF